MEENSAYEPGKSGIDDLENRSLTLINQ